MDGSEAQTAYDSIEVEERAQVSDGFIVKEPAESEERCVVFCVSGVNQLHRRIAHRIAHREAFPTFRAHLADPSLPSAPR